MTSGEWLAPYTGTVVTNPSKLDIDHMVPLGNAHISGASNWSANQRERYSNYLDEPEHLIAVTASANRSKGARGPEDWKPDDRSYWCQYAVDWITIKDDWGLTVTQREHGALDGVVGDRGATTGDEDSGAGYNARLEILMAVTDTYLIQVSKQQYGGSGTYKLFATTIDD